MLIKKLQKLSDFQRESNWSQTGVKQWTRTRALHLLDRDSSAPPYLSVSFVLVPDEPQLGVGGHAVVGSDVAVEQSALHPDRFTCQNMVLFQIHRPVEAAVH